MSWHDMSSRDLSVLNAHSPQLCIAPCEYQIRHAYMEWETRDAMLVSYRLHLCQCIMYVLVVLVVSQPIYAHLPIPILIPYIFKKYIRKSRDRWIWAKGENFEFLFSLQNIFCRKLKQPVGLSLLNCEISEVKSVSKF